MRYWPGRAAAVLAIAGFALLAGISSATAATLPTGFEERTVVSGLTAPTAVAWAPDGRMFVAEKGGKVRVVTAAGALVSKPLIDISDHVNTNGDRGLLGLAVDSSFASNRYLYLLYTYDAERFGVGSAEVVAAHAGHGERGQHGVGRDRSCSAATPRSRARRLRTTWTASRRTATRTRSGPSARLPTARCGSARATASNYGGVDPKAVRTHNEQSSQRQDHPRRPQRARAAGPSVLPGRHGPHPGVHQGVGEGIPQPVPLHDPAERPARGGRRGLGLVGGAQPRAARAQLRLAVLRGHARSPAATRACPPARTSTRRRARRPVSPSPTTCTRTARASSIIGGPTYTGGPYPDEFDGDIIFGDYVQGFIKRLELDGAGKPTGTKDFATDWFGVDIELWNGELYYVNFGDGGRGSGSVVRIAYSPNNSTPIAVATATPTFGRVAAEGHVQGQRLERSRRRPAQVRVGLRRRHREEHGRRIRPSTPTRRAATSTRG